MCHTIETLNATGASEELRRLDAHQLCCRIIQDLVWTGVPTMFIWNFHSSEQNERYFLSNKTKSLGQCFLFSSGGQLFRLQGL